MTPLTILGASGFIGSALLQRFKETGVEYFSPGKDERLPTKRLGHVIYCIGLTADFRSHPFETVEAHVCHLSRVLHECDFQSLLYLSSSRVYQERAGMAREEDPVQVSSSRRDDLYNISKVMGESLSLACGKKTRVARLSNVYGDDFASENFLSTIIREAVSKTKVTVHTAPESEKDYVSIRDVVDGLIQIAVEGKESIYNLASGMNVSNQQLTGKISELTDCQIVFEPEAVRKYSPPINIDRMRSEFGFRPRNVLDDLSKLIDSYSRYYARTGGSG
jgi:nucleoside-diphosphate-sugar epimerase